MNYYEDEFVTIPEEPIEELINPMNENYYDQIIPPNDIKFKYQWALQKLSNQADINAQEGWKEYLSATNGGNANKEVIVAVIDTGVRYD